MGSAELATGDGTNLFGTGGDYIYPPFTPQGQSNFVTLMEATGTGIGSVAAHELGHQLRAPYMDCGNQDNPNGYVPCDGGSNFVYEFFASSGYPPNLSSPSTSQGGQFFYVTVPGAYPHWGYKALDYLETIYNKNAN